MYVRKDVQVAFPKRVFTILGQIYIRRLAMDAEVWEGAAAV